MKTITVNLYSFNELSKEAKEKALQNLIDINVDYNWWESTYEDAANIGLKITSFGLDRDSHAKGEFSIYPTEAANKILSEHGENCETYKTAKNYLEEIKVIDETTEDEGQEELTDIQEEFLKSLLEDYSIILQKEYEYLTSEKALIETIEANDYTFEADGTMNNG